MKTCENCGEPVYSLGCTSCDEGAYIAEQVARQREFDCIRDMIERGEHVEEQS